MMRRTILRILAIACLVAVAWAVGRYGPATKVSASPTATPIPYAWGSCKAAALFQMPTGIAKSCLVFEDSAGVIRLVDTKTGKLALSFGRN